MGKQKKRKWPFVVLIFIIVVVIEIPTRNIQIQKEKKRASRDAAVTAIDEAILSLSTKPNQFSLSVSATGLNVVHSGSGGTGLSVTATGGGPGSQTTDLNITMDSHDIQIVQQTATKALVSESEKTIQILRDLKQALIGEIVDNSAVDSLLTNLKDTYVPPIISSIIGKLVVSCF